MLKELIVLSSLVLLVSCGGGSGGLSSEAPPSLPATPLPDVVSHSSVELLPMDYSLPRHSYVIGGQSNGQRLLYVVAGLQTDPLTYVADLVPGNQPNVTGHATGGMPINYWLDPVNAAPVLDVVRSQCHLNPYYVWYQGESDSGVDRFGTPDYLAYKDKLFTWFNQIITACPNVAIVEISIAKSPEARKGLYVAEIVKIQQTLPGIPYIDADLIAQQYGYYWDGGHLIQPSYEALWNEIVAKYPLTP